MTAYGFTQEHLADPARGDGHTAEGIPGDCLRAAVATVLNHQLKPIEPAALRHYAQDARWWESMRIDARKHGVDWAYIDNPADAHVWGIPAGALLIGCGPSPRGDFRHVVVVDTALRLVRDPHPSGAGVVEVDELFVMCQPYDPAPERLALVAAP